MTREQLESYYRNAVDHLIPLCDKLRKNSGSILEARDLTVCFNGGGWVDQKPSSGHAHYKHELTRVSVGYQAHKKQVAMNTLKTLMPNIQLHLNILSNRVFQYDRRNWREPPDYTNVLRNFALWEREESRVIGRVSAFLEEEKKHQKGDRDALFIPRK